MAQKKAPQKPKAKTSKVKTPRFFSLANRKFVVLLVVVLAAAAYGSYKLYSASAGTYKRGYPTVADCMKFNPDPYLAIGVTNQTQCTKTLQGFLNNARSQNSNQGFYSYWPYLEIDGNFGNKTKLATVVFQNQLTSAWTLSGYTTFDQLAGDGAVGPTTWRKIEDYCRKTTLKNYCGF